MSKDFYYMINPKFTDEIEMDKLTKENKILKYTKPFIFKIYIDSNDKYDLLNKAFLTSIIKIDFSNAGINNIDFLANNTLENLKYLSLNKNNIEDISILTEEKIHFHNLKSLDLRENPIKKGLEVLKQKFFKKCVYVKIDLVEQELKIIAEFNYQNYNLDIYVNDLNEIPNIFEKDKVFFNSSTEEVNNKLRDIFSLTSEDYSKKCEIFNLLSNYTSWSHRLNNGEKLYYDTHNIKWIYELNDEETKNKKDIIFSTLKLLSNNDENDINIKNLFSDLDIYINSNKFNMIIPNFDLNSLISTNEFKSLENIELSDFSFIDIKLLCESEYFINLKVLKLSNNNKIVNIKCLEKAAFINLKELYLNNNNLEDINFLCNVPFTHLIKLDLSENNINILPYLNFPELEDFNLKNNKINYADQVSKIGSSKCKFNLKGNYVSKGSIEDYNVEDKMVII